MKTVAVREAEQKQQAYAKHHQRNSVGRDDTRGIQPGFRADRLDWQCDHCMLRPCSRFRLALVLAGNDAALRTPLGIQTRVNSLKPRSPPLPFLLHQCIT